MTTTVPRLRGRLHQLAFLTSVPAGAALVVIARDAVARTASVVYALSLVGLYGASAAYHRLRVSPRVKGVLRRLDHSMIFVLIAGSYTPFSLLALEGWWSTAMLVVVWTGAAVGVALKVLRFDQLSKLGSALYIVLGWVVLVSLPQLLEGLDGGQLTLLFCGGVLYTVGAVILLLRRPDPLPSWFGYHEVWHTFVVVAGLCHYVAIASLVR